MNRSKAAKRLALRRTTITTLGASATARARGGWLPYTAEHTCDWACTQGSCEECPPSVRGDSCDYCTDQQSVIDCGSAYGAC